MPRGKRVVRSGTYRTKKRAMRGRRLRRDSVYWVLAGAFAVVLALGVYQVGSGGWRSVSSWWRARQEAAALRGDNAPVTIAIIGVDLAKAPKVARGLGVVQIVPSEKRVRGITFPGDTFVEVPGQGFERAAEALRLGPATAVATIQNLLGVPVKHYIILDQKDYKALTEQGMAGVLINRAVRTDIPIKDRLRYGKIVASVPAGEALMVPLPVRTISVGSGIYYEAQRSKIADVLKAWWGIVETAENRPLRIKILNGVGTPGIAGDAAKPLIRAGFRVVDTTNASSFAVGRTRIIVYHATKAQAEQIRNLLGVGRIVASAQEQDVVDVVVIIGRDFKPQKT